MKLNVHEIPVEGIELDLSENVAINERSGQAIPVSANLRAFRDGSSVIITGEAHTDVELQCGRCLEKFVSEIDADVNITYLPEKESEAMPEKHMLREEELNTGYYADDSIDVSGLLSELVSVNIPIKPLCSEECKGLCPKCGTNLNAGACECKDEVIDERWSKLKILINERKEE